MIKAGTFLKLGQKRFGEKKSKGEILENEAKRRGQKPINYKKAPDAGKDRGQEGKRATENEMVGWHHQLNGHESEQTPGDSGGQRSLACCSPQGRKESDTTEQLNNSCFALLCQFLLYR